MAGAGARGLRVLSAVVRGGPVDGAIIACITTVATVTAATRDVLNPIFLVPHLKKSGMSLLAKNIE